MVLDNEVVARGLSDAGVPRCGTSASSSSATPDSAATACRRRRPRSIWPRPACGSRGWTSRAHDVPQPRPDTRVFFDARAELFKRAGIPVPVVSGGGTPALFSVEKFPMLTEHRAGTCVYNDAMVVDGHRDLGNCAMRVRATVVSRPTTTRRSSTAGTKVLTSDPSTGRRLRARPGVPGGGDHRASPEEHGVGGSHRLRRAPAGRRRRHVVPNHCCVVTNMVDEVYGVRNGRVGGKV